MSLINTSSSRHHSGPAQNSRDLTFDRNAAGLQNRVRVAMACCSVLRFAACAQGFRARSERQPSVASAKSHRQQSAHASAAAVFGLPPVALPTSWLIPKTRRRCALHHLLPASLDPFAIGAARRIAGVRSTSRNRLPSQWPTVEPTNKISVQRSLFAVALRKAILPLYS